MALQIQLACNVRIIDLPCNFEYRPCCIFVCYNEGHKCVIDFSLERF